MKPAHGASWTFKKIFIAFLFHVLLLCLNKAGNEGIMVIVLQNLSSAVQQQNKV